MWLKRLMHLIAYTIGIFMIASTWLSQLPVYEQIFRTGIVLYLSIIYVEFVDGSMLRRMKLSNLFEDKAKQEGLEDVDDLIQAFRMSLHWIRLVQQSETPEERHMHLDRLQQSIEFIEQMKLPKRHRKNQQDILRDVQGIYVGMAE